MKKAKLHFRNIFKNISAAKLIAFSFVVAILIAGSFISFYNTLQNNIRKHAEGYLTENGNNAVNTLNHKAESIFSSLSTLSSYIASQSQITSSGVLQVLKEQTLTNEYSTMIVITPDGIGYTADSFSCNVKDRDYFQAAMKGKNTVSNIITSRTSEEPSIVFAVPIYKDNKVIGVLGCVYRSQMFIDLLKITSFSGNGRILLIQNDGTAIIGSPRLQQGDNYFSVLQKAILYDNASFASLIQKTKIGESALVHYWYAGESDYASLLPVHLNNWYIVSVVPSTYIENQSKQISGYGLVMIFEILAVLFLFIVYIFYLERKNAKALFDSNQKFESLADNVPGGVLRCDTDENISLDFVSDGCLRLLGCTREQFTEQYQNKYENIIYEKDRPKAMKRMTRQLQQGHHVSIEFRIMDSDGNIRWIFHHGRVVTEANNKKWQYVVLTDISKLKETQEELRQSFERYRIVIEQSDSVLVEYNLKTDSAYVSENFVKMFGYELSQHHFSEAILEQNVIHVEDADILHQAFQQIQNGASHKDVDLRIRKDDGSFLWCKVQATTVFDNLNTPSRVLAKVTDISAEKAETESLLAQAQRDPLTGFYNKATAQTLIDQCLKTESQSKVCVLFMLDIDHFKQANDTFGHLFGDAVLTEMSSKIKKLFRSSDIIGRVGGDEFVLFLKNISNESDIAAKAHEICEIIRSISIAEHSDFEISGSIGIALSPKDGSNYLNLFKKADKALYYSKNHGKNGYTFYNIKDMAAYHHSLNSSN